MTALGQAHLLLLHCVRQNGSAATQVHPVAQTLLTLGAASLVLTIAACSSNSARERSSQASSQSSPQSSTQVRLIREGSIQERSATYRTAVHPRPGRQAHRSDRTLVAHEVSHESESVAEPVHESPPNCEFKGPEPETVDADQWARLKLDYERHCFEQAEEADRKRLDQLLASGKCRAKSN
jgi:hypothetical protein